MKPQDIVPGQSYACYYTLRDIPLDKWNRPGGLLSLADVPIHRTGDWEGFGVIQTRDTQQELFEIWDTELKRTFVVAWQDCRDIDVAELEE